MDQVTGNVVQGTMNGTMTIGAALVASRVGNGLYTDGETGHLNYGNHHTECCHIPDMCDRGVTFAMWMKRGDGTGSGIVLYTVGYRFASKCKGYENITCNISGYVVKKLPALHQKST